MGEMIGAFDEKHKNDTGHRLEELGSVSDDGWDDCERSFLIIINKNKQTGMVKNQVYKSLKVRFGPY